MRFILFHSKYVVVDETALLWSNLGYLLPCEQLATGRILTWKEIIEIYFYNSFIY